MPAAELTKLRAQIDRLAGLFSQPADFQRELRNLFEQYSDLAYRPGQTITKLQVTPAYRPPALVIRRLELELTALTQAHGEQALAIVDKLWEESHLEPRLLGATLLGQIPLSQAEGVLERLRGWARPLEDRLLLEAILERGTARLRHEGPDALLELYDGWLSGPDPAYRLIGLKALLPLIRDSGFENLPPIFDALFPLARTASSATFGDLAAVLEELAGRTPAETVFFLRQVLSAPYQSHTPRLVRRILPFLSESQQESLRAVLRSKNTENLP